ncbi:hypothetical protein KY284_024682 [Solanum tuberosum]|nr:hypothetical protein KY284_024682 [Solanum tuberosum]
MRRQKSREIVIPYRRVGKGNKVKDFGAFFTGNPAGEADAAGVAVVVVPNDVVILLADIQREEKRREKKTECVDESKDTVEIMEKCLNDVVFSFGTV